jgi:hypothetical protein
MKPPYRLILIFAAFGLVCPLASGQAVLDKTDFGKSQNTPEDLANSLVPGKPRAVGRGEKKEEVDPRSLTSKTVKDTTFQGTLMDIGVEGTGGVKLQDKKGGGISDKDSKASNKTDGVVGKDAKVSQPGGSAGDKNSNASKPAQTGDGQNKDEKAKSVPSDEKSSDKEKTSASKPDGDR